MFNAVISAEIAIDAPAQRVWTVLADLAGYAAWNPFTTHVESTLQDGAEVRMQVQMGPHWRLENRCTVSAVDPPHRLCWRNTLGAAWLQHSERCQTLEVVAEGQVVYRTREEFHGPLVPLTMLVARRAVLRGFRAVCQGVKAAVENVG